MRVRLRAEVGSVERMERDWRREVFVGFWAGGRLEVRGREMLESFREGGPRKREGGGARWG